VYLRPPQSVHVCAIHQAGYWREANNIIQRILRCAGGWSSISCLRIVSRRHLERTDLQLTPTSALWVLTAMFVFLHWRNHRFADSSRNITSQSTAAPVYHGEIPFNDMGNRTYNQVLRVPAPADCWGQPIITPMSDRGPIIPDTTTTEEEESPRASEEAASYPPSGATFSTGSPVLEPASYPPSGLTFSAESPAEGGVIDLKGFIASHLAPSTHHITSHTASEATGPPSDTEQIDWSARPSSHATRTESTLDRRVRRLTMGELDLDLEPGYR
jgi:hypothetical protein